MEVSKAVCEIQAWNYIGWERRIQVSGDGLPAGADMQSPAFSTKAQHSAGIGQRFA
jgi:hypothetical protein